MIGHEQFLHLTRQPDFFQTCGFNKIIKAIVVHNLNTKNLHINGFFFSKSQKTYFWVGIIPKIRFFSQMSSSISFLRLKHSNFKRSLREILWAILEKTLTYWHNDWWNHRTPFRLKADLQQYIYILFTWRWMRWQKNQHT